MIHIKIKILESIVPWPFKKLNIEFYRRNESDQLGPHLSLKDGDGLAARTQLRPRGAK